MGHWCSVSAGLSDSQDLENGSMAKYVDLWLIVWLLANMAPLALMAFIYGGP